MRVEIIEVDFLGGENIEIAIQEAKNLAWDHPAAVVCFRFNGVNLYITTSTDNGQALQHFNNALHCARFLRGEL